MVLDCGPPPPLRDRLWGSRSSLLALESRESPPHNQMEAVQGKTCRLSLTLPQPVSPPRALVGGPRESGL